MPQVRRDLVDTAVYSYFEQVGLDVEATQQAIQEGRDRKVAEISALLAQADAEAHRAADRLARVRRDYADGELDAADWRGFREELGGEQEAAAAEVVRLRTSLAEARAVGADAEIETLERLAEIRRAVVGEVRAAEGVAAVRAALARLFERFVLHQATDAPTGIQSAELALVPGFVIEPIIRAEAIAEEGEYRPILRRAPLEQAENNQRKGVPKHFVAYYKGAAHEFELGSRGAAILAAIHKVETNFGTSDLPGVKSGSNPAGAKGPMQFLQPTWDAYGIDGDRDGDKDVYENHDAIFGAANYLSASGAPGEWYRAIFAYNHSDVYVAEVERYAQRFGDFGDVSIEVTECGLGAEGGADLSKAIRVTEPRAYKSLPAELMAAGRAPQPVDARIYDNAVWALRHYKLRVTAAREGGHLSHGDGSALEIVPAGDIGSQAVWDRSTGVFAEDLGWSRECARSGVAPSCPLVPAIRFVGYDGYPGHGSPRTCGGGCPAHLHVSWQTASGGTATLVPPAAWALVFVSPGAGSRS